MNEHLTTPREKSAKKNEVFFFFIYACSVCFSGGRLDSLVVYALV